MLKINKSKKILVLIPARKNSKRVKNKNIKKFNAKPLIYWTWKNCSKAISANNIFVATDSKKIAKVCKEYGIQSINMQYIQFLSSSYQEK